MHLMLSPMRGLPGQKETVVVVAGDTIIVNGVAFDLAPVPEGGLAEPEGDHPFVGVITRQGGVIHATVRIRLDEIAAPHQPVDVAHWTIPEAEGVIEMPALRRSPTAAAGEVIEGV
jgi:endonuclease YncB( thermonuclease family)